MDPQLQQSSESWVPQIVLFRRKYIQLLDVALLDFPKVSTWRLAIFQLAFFRNVLSDDAYTHQPPPLRYRLRVLKRIVEDIQQSFQDVEEDEISDDILEMYSSLMLEAQAPEAEAVQEIAFATYTLPSSMASAQEVVIGESHSVLAVSGSTGMRTWEAALHLGTLFCSSFGEEFVQDKHMLELGAGTGFLSILCAKYLGARHVRATDGSDQVMTRLRDNISYNHLENDKRISTSHLLWKSPIGDVEDGAWERLGEYDLIIGADVTYDPKSIPSLVFTIRLLLLQKSKAKAIISATVRSHTTVQNFLNACTNSSLAVEDIRTSPGRSEPQLGFFHSTLVPIRVFLLSLKHDHEPS